ncbi:MAG: lipoprotein-releasing system ATP-binding [Planctomycetota bacterium]|nr:MAG: lipoprotein-releasing system ATP-binding [Planctomycetota bacterium]
MTVLEPSPPIVSLRSLTRVYRMGDTLVTALDRLDLDIARGAFFGVVGRSGSGKSTFLNLLGGLDTPTAGTIEVDGLKVTGASQDSLAAYRRNKVGFIFQQFNLIQSQTALQNVEMPLVFASVPPAERRKRAEELLDRVGLGPRRKHRPVELSGGEQQRVAIARALANRPAILLADEPTGNLDSATAASVTELLKQMNRDGQTIVLVTHDRPVAEAVCSRFVELKDGRVLTDSAAPATQPAAGA